MTPPHNVKFFGQCGCDRSDFVCYFLVGKIQDQRVQAKVNKWRLREMVCEPNVHEISNIKWVRGRTRNKLCGEKWFSTIKVNVG